MLDDTNTVSSRQKGASVNRESQNSYSCALIDKSEAKKHRVRSVVTEVAQKIHKVNTAPLEILYCLVIESGLLRKKKSTKSHLSYP